MTDAAVIVDLSEEEVLYMLSLTKVPTLPGVDIDAFLELHPEAQAVALEEEVEGVAEWFNGEKSPITLSLELANVISGSAVGSPFT